MIATMPTGWRGRVLALAVLLVVLAAFYVVAVAPLLDLYAGREATAATKRSLLPKLNAVAGELPALRTRVAELRTATDSRKLTLEGASDAVASAALQGRIEQLARAAAVTIGSTEILPAEMQGEYHRIGLRLLMNGPYTSLVQLLAKVETATPPLVVDNLQIRSLARRAAAPALSAPGLDASLDIYGFRENDIPAKP